MLWGLRLNFLLTEQQSSSASHALAAGRADSFTAWIRNENQPHWGIRTAMEFPLFIMRHEELSYQQKAFLLWCWSERSNDSRFDLMSRRQYCAVRDHSIRRYARYLGFGLTQFFHNFNDLKNKEFIKIERAGTRNECTYLDFTHR